MLLVSGQSSVSFYNGPVIKFWTYTFVPSKEAELGNTLYYSEEAEADLLALVS